MILASTLNLYDTNNTALAFMVFKKQTFLKSPILSFLLASSNTGILMRQHHKIFDLCFWHRIASSAPIIGSVGLFRILTHLQQLRGDIQN